VSRKDLRIQNILGYGTVQDTQNLISQCIFVVLISAPLHGHNIMNSEDNDDVSKFEKYKRVKISEIKIIYVRLYL